MRLGYVMSSVWNWFHNVGDSGPLYWRKTSMQLQRRGAKMRRGAVLVCLRLEVVHSMPIGGNIRIVYSVKYVVGVWENQVGG